jgi:alginate O-acetyltransferase complex protein AlgI
MLMLFNSYTFVIFFTLVVGLFFALPHRYRWILLLGASYFYYMYWDPRYGILILTTTVVVYATALLMNGKPVRTKKLYVALSVVINLGILVLFKYFNFINNSLKDLFTMLGAEYNVPAMTLLMPIGISFYTFMAISYTLDVYRGKREPERNFGIFALYVSFFPVLLAGPIERSTTLLPQFYREVEYDYDRFTDGLKLIAWGLFQKLVIADRIGMYMAPLHNHPEMFNGLPLLTGIYLYPIQVYCDFAGYTDVAIGTAQVLGFKLMENFRRPFIALSLAEMWRRWHISLISWFRDYVYIPMGGNRVSKLRHNINILVVFTLSGLWHGAQWTFVLWGLLNGIFMVISMMTVMVREWLRETFFGGLGKVPAAVYLTAAALLIAGAVLSGPAGIPAGAGARASAAGAGALLFVLGVLRVRGPVMERFLQVSRRTWMKFWTFNLFAFAGVFFGVRSVKDGWYMITHCLGTNFLNMFMVIDLVQFSLIIALTVLLLVVHYIQETRGSIRAMVRARPLWVRWAIYTLLCSSILLLGVRGSQQFIYFRF